MTDDQQFWLGLATLIVPTIASVFAYRKTSDTHKAVDGMQARRVRAARKSARAEGVALGAHSPQWAKPPSTDVPLQRPPDGS